MSTLDSSDYHFQLSFFSTPVWSLRFEYAMNPESCERDIRRNKIEPSSLPWILQSKWQPRCKVLSLQSKRKFPALYDTCSVANIPRGVLGTRVNQNESGYMSDACERANSISIRIFVDVEIFESAKKKLRIQKYPDTCGVGLILINAGYMLKNIFVH